MTITGLVKAEVMGEFDRTAPHYDRLVGLDPGYHAHLRSAAGLVARAVGPGARVLDAGCGTGASTQALLSMLVDPEIVAVDASAGMIEVARRKPWPSSVRFVAASIDDLPDLPDLPALGVSGTVDAVFAAYLLRNVPDPDTTLAALRGLLRPGGVLVLHDYSLAERPLPRLTWTAVCWSAIIPAAWLVSGDTRLYRYLWRSVREFDSPSRLRRRLLEAGFTRVSEHPAHGWHRGILHTITATAPSGPRGTAP